jgi:hypothetical protein
MRSGLSLGGSAAGGEKYLARKNGFWYSLTLLKEAQAGNCKMCAKDDQL